MRTVMQTLVAEIGDADSTRQDIRHSVYATQGTNYCNSHKIYTFTCSSLNSPDTSYKPSTGPNPRSRLRPEINRNRQHVSFTKPASSGTITPPSTPRSTRIEQWVYKCSCKQPSPIAFLLTEYPNAYRTTITSDVETLCTSSPVFSSDDDNMICTPAPPGTMLSPISSPERGLNFLSDAALTQATRCNKLDDSVIAHRGSLSPAVCWLSISFSCLNISAEGYKTRLHSCKYDSYDPTLADPTPSFLETYIHFGKISRTNRYCPQVAQGAESWYQTGTLPGALPLDKPNPLPVALALQFPIKPRCLPNQLITYLLFSYSTSFDILQAATEAAGIDGDSSFSVEYDSPSPPPPREQPHISTPNRNLINSRDPRKMPKSKNNHRGSGDTSPPKTSCTQGRHFSNELQHLLQSVGVIECLLPYFLLHTLAPPEDDLLNMSGIQDGEEVLNSSDLNSTLQGDASMNSGGNDANENGGSTPDPEHFEQRQSTPNQETPRSNNQDNESEDGSSSNDDEEDDNAADGDEASQTERDMQSDLGKVREAVSLAGGLNSRKPDFEKQKEREGEHVEIVDQWMDFTNDTFDDLPERPDKSTFRRISLKELLPPPTTTPVPLDMEIDGEELTFVANQRIEFLVIMRKEGDTKASWGFPCETQLLKLYNHVRNEADHDQIMDVCLWCRVDGAIGIASIMLSTINLPLFTRIRHEIRIYAGFSGFRCETYSKITFMQKYGVTLYIPKEVAGMNDKRLFRTLFRKYRYLNVRFLILTRTTFTKDHPDKPPISDRALGTLFCCSNGLIYTRC